jgi:nicotinamide mononucleotide transporter
VTHADSLVFLEWSATAFTALSVGLAARRHVATWPVGIIGCVLFGALFYRTQLYADATLQAFFIVTSLMGWRQWLRLEATLALGSHDALRWQAWLRLVMIGVVVTWAYGALLAYWTQAFAPFWDSAVMIASVIAQVLLMQRRRETWPWWLLVNTLSVPLFLSRGLHLTAALYTLFWFNAWYGWWRWHRLHLKAVPHDGVRPQLGP